MRDIAESDWKKFRSLRETALERFCADALSGVRDVLDQPSDMTNHQRYLALFELLRRWDDELALAFNASSRSKAMLQLLSMRRLGLVTDEEFSQFGPETGEWINSALSLAAQR
jgi:hypothetical protein